MRHKSATATKAKGDLSRSDRRGWTQLSVRSVNKLGQGGSFKQAITLFLKQMTNATNVSLQELERLGMSRQQLVRAKAAASRILSRSRPRGITSQFNGLYIASSASISRSHALPPKQGSVTEASTMMASSPAQISPAKIAQFISEFDISHDPAWRIFSRSLEHAEIFAVECPPYAVATKADGSFHGRANLQVNAVDRGLQQTKIGVSYDVPVEVRGHVEGDQVVVDALAFD